MEKRPNVKMACADVAKSMHDFSRNTKSSDCMIVNLKNVNKFFWMQKLKWEDLCVLWHIGFGMLCGFFVMLCC